MMRRAGRVISLTLLPAVSLLAGCGGDDDRSSASPAPSAEATDERVETTDAAEEPDLRRVIYTASLTVRVQNVAKATREARNLVGDADGVVFALTSDLTGHEEARLTIKVPPMRFDESLDALAELGRTLARDVKAEDVTDEVVDLEGRLKTAQASA